MMQSKCPDCGFKKSAFVKEQVAKSLLSNLGIKTLLSKFPLLNVFFWMWLLHLKQPGFTYSACGPFTRKKERFEKFMQTSNTDFIYKNEVDKACFQHDMAYGKWKDLTKRTQSDNILKKMKCLKLQVILNMMVIKED